jgi:hypothetical protein
MENEKQYSYCKIIELASLGLENYKTSMAFAWIKQCESINLTDCGLSRNSMVRIVHAIPNVRPPFKILWIDGLQCMIIRQRKQNTPTCHWWITYQSYS